MESRTKIVLCVLPLFSIGLQLAGTVQIDSQIDFDSDEKNQSTLAPMLKAFVNLNEGIGRLPFASLSKPSAFRPNIGNEFPRVGDGKKRRRLTIQGDSSKQMSVVNNIEIVMNGNETELGETACKNGICNVSVSSSTDDAGNIVTNIYLSILTKVNKDFEVKDVPVFEGTRGVKRTDDPSLVYHPLYYPPMPHFYNTIPQIQTRNPDYNEVSYRSRGTFYRPPTNWRYRHVTERTNNRFHGPGEWVPSRPLVDDKIEPPLSKTQSGSA